MFNTNNIHIDKLNTYWVCDYIGNKSKHSIFVSYFMDVRQIHGENNSCAELKYDEITDSLFIQSTDYRLVKGIAELLNQKINQK